MYHVSLAFHYVYGYNNERKENRDGRLGVRFMEEGKVWMLTFSYMQITWLCVANRKRSKGDGGTLCSVECWKSKKSGLK